MSKFLDEFQISKASLLVSVYHLGVKQVVQEKKVMGLKVQKQGAKMQKPLAFLQLHSQILLVLGFLGIF